MWFVFTGRLPAKILIMTTPPFLQVVFVLRNLFSRRRAELILWNQDTYPEILAAVGIVRKSSVFYRLLLAMQRWSIARVDKVIALDHAMKALLQQHGGKHIEIIPNWEIGLAVDRPPENDELAERIRRAKAEYRYLVIYTGNYGWGHNLTIVCDYLRQNPKQRDFFFLFVGGGEKWQTLVHLQRQHQIECMDVIFYIPRSRSLALLREAHFGLVALERSCVGLMAPSKIYSYLACGKPLIYIGPDGSNVADAIDNYQCGFRIEEDDIDGLHHCLESLLADTFDYEALSRSAAKAVACRYSETAAVPDVLRVIHSPVATPHRGH